MVAAAQQGPANQVVVAARPAHPSNVVRAIYTVNGGAARIARGYRMRAAARFGEEVVRLDLPPQPDGAFLAFMPILSRSGRRPVPAGVGSLLHRWCSRWLFLTQARHRRAGIAHLMLHASPSSPSSCSGFRADRARREPRRRDARRPSDDVCDWSRRSCGRTRPHGRDPAPRRRLDAHPPRWSGDRIDRRPHQASRRRSCFERNTAASSISVLTATRCSPLAAARSERQSA